MKKILLFFLFILLSVSVYYDFTEGILADAKPDTAASNDIDDQNMIEVTVEPGQTVLSVVEKLHDKPVSASIETIINDFRELNDGTDPTSIKVDKSYYFPLYSP